MKSVFLILSLVLALSVTQGCVWVGTYHQLTKDYEASVKVNEELKTQIGDLGPTNTRLREENEHLKIRLAEADKLLAEFKGTIESSDWGRLVTAFQKEAVDWSKQEKMEGLTVYEDEGTLGISQELLFAPGSIVVKDAAKPVLRKIKEIVTDPRYSEAVIQIEGHTDTQPVRVHKEMENNWKLSALRAYAVLMELKSMGIPESRLSGAFWGEWKPRIPTGPNVQKAENRRVEIRLVRKNR